MTDKSTQGDGSIATDDQQSDAQEFQFDHGTEQNSSEDSVEDGSEDVTLDDLREVVTAEFDGDMWDVTEAILSAHATLLIDSVHNCTGLILVGESGAGKTTAIRFLEGIDEQVYRSDEMTPASFVSHDASRSDSELEDVDLLPRIKHKSLTCRDMSTWFAGEYDSIRTRMARMAYLMDGEGLTRDSGTHGKRGYEGGDFRFTIVGATTPLKPRAWSVMSHTGQRFVFHEKCSGDPDPSQLKSNLFGQTRYFQRVEACREYVHGLLQHLWDEFGGYKNVDSVDISDDAQDALLYLGKVVKFSRATLSQTNGERRVESREGIHRITAILRDIAQGRALLEKRKTVTLEDVQVSARIALSTMPRKRRALIRSLLDPSNDTLRADEVEDLFGVSRPTATDRMRIAIALEIGEWAENDDGRGMLEIKVTQEFEWPDTLDFPHFGGVPDA